MGRVVSLEAAVREVATARGRGARVALANGAFDLLHAGHVRYLRGAREHGDVLVVAVNSDMSVRGAKGPNRPVVPQDERAEIVSAIEGVDWVVVFDEPTVAHIIEALRPDVQVKGTDYTPIRCPRRRS